MFKRRGSMMGGIAALFIISCATFSREAYGKSLWAYFWDGGTGNSYRDCVNRLLSANGYGLDSSGNTVCFANAQTTGAWQVNTGSCASAVNHKTVLLGNFLSYCEGPVVSWTSQSSCSKKFFSQPASGGACVERTLWSYSQGTP
jgi:hypothetical protein